MSLTRANVTTASRVMLPTYVLLFAWLGVNYLLTPATRLHESPALDYASAILPMRLWGGMFLAASLAMAGALVMQHRLAFRIALWVGLVCLVIWAAVFGLAAIFSTASPSAAAWPLFAAAACFASDRSLLKAEVS